VVGENGGLQHIFYALSKALDYVDYEALTYGVKLVVNLCSNDEICFVIAEAGYVDYLCRISNCLKDGPKHGQTDVKLKKYSKIIINECLKAIKLLACNKNVQYNKIVLIEKS
jgi:hypothetical protein